MERTTIDGAATRLAIVFPPARADAEGETMKRATQRVDGAFLKEQTGVYLQTGLSF
jgi:hypothetical protein